MGLLVPVYFVWFNAAWVILSNLVDCLVTWEDHYFCSLDQVFEDISPCHLLGNLEGKTPSCAYDQSKKVKRNAHTIIIVLVIWR